MKKRVFLGWLITAVFLAFPFNAVADPREDAQAVFDKFKVDPFVKTTI